MPSHIWSICIQYNPINMVPLHLAVFNVFMFMTLFQTDMYFYPILQKGTYVPFFQSCIGRLYNCWHRYWTWHLLICLPFSSNIVIWQKVWVPLVALLGILNPCIRLQQPFYWHLRQCHTLNRKISVSFCEMLNSFVISFQMIWKKKLKLKKCQWKNEFFRWRYDCAFEKTCHEKGFDDTG